MWYCYVLIDFARRKALIWDANNYICTELKETISMTSIQCHRATSYGKGKVSTFGEKTKGVRWKEWYRGKVLTNSLNVNDGGLGGHVH